MYVQKLRLQENHHAVSLGYTVSSPYLRCRWSILVRGLLHSDHLRQTFTVLVAGIDRREEGDHCPTTTSFNPGCVVKLSLYDPLFVG